MNFFWILLFGSFVALTERPIDLVSGENDVPLRVPISAITHGASLFIDITSMIPKDEVTIELSRRWVEKNVSHGCLKAVLRGENPAAVPLEFKGGSSFEPAIHERLQSAGAGDEEEVSGEDEELVEKCIEVMRQEKKASTSLFQRRLRLGYTRAARILDILEARGYVAAGEGAKPREILRDLDAL